jgi:hypothetical protein
LTTAYVAIDEKMPRMNKTVSGCIFSSCLLQISLPIKKEIVIESPDKHIKKLPFHLSSFPSYVFSEKQSLSSTLIRGLGDSS